MQIEAVISMSLLACLLFACSNPPKLSEPKGAFIFVNPEMPSYLAKKNIVKMAPIVSKIRPRFDKAEGSKVSKTVVKPTNNNTSRPKKTEMPKGFLKKVSVPPSSSVSNGKNHFLEKVSPVKPMPPVKPVLPPRIWTVKLGGTLKQVFIKWAGNEKCHTNKNWSVLWNTQTDYPIDSPLTFTGSFEEMTMKLFSLYRHANVPLYVNVYKSQCLIIIDNDEKKGKKIKKIKGDHFNLRA